MRISLKQYLQTKFRKPSSYYSVGIAFTAEQVLLCALKKTDEGIAWVLDASFTHQTWASGLAKYVKKHELEGTPCYFTLSAHWYKIHQIERPDVADDELISALKWPMQELLGSATEMVYDYAELPIQVAGQNKIMVVAISKSEIEKLTRTIYDADLILEGISVEEFATLELTPSSQEAVITLVQEHGEDVLLNIVRGKQLYFSRRLTGFENIASFSEAELDMGITDSLTVQIQRSMDYFESQLRQAPVKRILLKLDTPNVHHVCNSIAEAMGMPCETLDPEIKCADNLNFQMASFSCLGAAYTKAVLAQIKESSHES